MIDYKKYFKNKKITLMGLGVLGRGVNLAKFLFENGAELIITDLKSEKELSSSLNKLKKFKRIKYVLGRHRLSDFKNRDMIIKAAGVPLNSPFIREAKKNRISVEMDASLFVKLSETKIIGVTGTRGKSTITHFIYQALKEYSKERVHLGGNIKGMATSVLLKKIKPNDIVILELDSWQLQGFGDSKISPDISVFTNFLPDHLDYYKGSLASYFNDKANIFKYQKKDNYLVLSQQALKEIKKRYKGRIKGQTIINNSLPKNWKIKLIGEHNRDNLALGVRVLEVLGLKKSFIKKAAEEYQGVPGRLEFIKKVDNISYYNDTNASSPEATIAALKAFDKENIILIAGGSDKNLDFKQMVQEIKKRVNSLILFKGKGTDKMVRYLKDYPFELVDNMKEAVKKARSFSQKGDIILLSPGAASFGVFKNEYDRGDQFNKYVR
jgi:UDP-N-acetylmuramoylalanine--D-glutamate ligase